MRVYKRKESGVYQIEISTPQGKKRFSSRTELKREAVAIATYHQHSVNDSIRHDRNVSMVEATEAYLNDMRLADSKLSEAQAELNKVMSDLSGKSDEEITKVTNLIKAFLA